MNLKELSKSKINITFSNVKKRSKFSFFLFEFQLKRRLNKERKRIIKELEKAVEQCI